MKETHGGNIWEAAAQTATPPEKILDFSASINPLTSAKVLSAIKDGIRHIHAYPDPASKALRATLAAFHGIDADQTLAGNGSTEFIHLLPQVFKPTRALIIAPAFSEYAIGLEKTGCAPAYLTLREDEGFTLNLPRLDAALKKGPKTDIVYLANPANPTGVLTAKDAVYEAIRICKRRNALMVVDEAFMDFIESESVKHEAIRSRHVIVLRSMTKFWAMAGLRAGYIVCNKTLVKKVAAHLPPWSINTLASLAARAALTDDGHRAATFAWLGREQRFLHAGLAGIQGLAPLPSSANFFMVRITAPPATASSLRRALYKDGLLIRDLSAMAGAGKKFFRVAVRTSDENKALLAALRKAF
ncbi:MAG: threonine-phosphate decarboxylase [Deltaproteobacteria bacterium]|nr:threonine-phosphate decarboxylase [Deltaproteobacteria bacterium]